MPAFSTSNVHLDVLMGRDESLDTVDFMMPSAYPSYCAIHDFFVLTIFCVIDGTLRQPLDIHAEMEKKLRL